MLDWTLGSDAATFIGLGNYQEFLTSDAGRESLRITLVFTVVTVGGAMLLGLLLSLALNAKLPGTTLARAAAFAPPYVLSGVGVGLVWLFIFDPNFGGPRLDPAPGGSVEPAMGAGSRHGAGHGDDRVRLEEPRLLRDRLSRRTAVAARRGPAGGRARRRGEAPPLLVDLAAAALPPTTFFLLITTMLSSLQAFDILRVMTPPPDAAPTPDLRVLSAAFGGYSRAGYSAAISVVLFVMLIVITVVQIRYVERKVHYA